MDSFEHDGVWWEPGAPEREWVGTLRFDAATGATLTVTMPTDHADPFPRVESYERIVGVTTGGRAVTLINCFEQATHGTFGAIPRRVEFFANTVIVGFHCESRDPLLSAASVTFQHLTEWCGHSGITPDDAVKAPDLAVRYSAPPPLVVHDDGAWRVSLGTGLTGSMGRHRIALREEVGVEFMSSTPQPLSEFRRRIQTFGDFLSIACSTVCAIEELALVPPRAPDDRPQRGTFHAVPIYEGRERSSSSVIVHALIRFSDIETRARDVFSKWFSQAGTLQDVRALFFLGVYGEGFVEGRLLALTQAAEAFHRRFYPGVYMAPAAFVTDVFEPMKAAIPKSVAESHRAAITARLRFANEFSQSRRLEALFNEQVEALRVLIDQPETWVKPILDNRNAFTHFDPSTELAHGPNHVLLYNFVLRLLIEACFLKAVGLTTEEIATLAHRSESYRQLARRFFKTPGGTEGGLALS